MFKSYTVAFLAFFIFVQIGNGQDTVLDPDVVVLDDVASSDFEGVGYSFVFNNSDFDKNFIWERNVIDITEGWTSAVCDLNLCHLDFVNSAQFFLAAGDTGNIDVHVYPNNFEGAAVIEVSVVNATNANDGDTATFYFNTALNTQERITNALKIYPNPSTDYFFVEGFENVGRLEIFNVTGKKVREFTGNQSGSFPISGMEQGNYIVRMWDDSGKQISSNILSVH